MGEKKMWRKNLGAVVVFVCVLTVCGLATAGPIQYTVTNLGTLGGSQSWAYALNNHGQVVGYASTVTGYEHAFLWQNGGMTDMGTLGGSTSRTNSINNSGQVVGYSQNTQGNTLGFIWQNGGMLGLGTLGGIQSYANAVNDSGQVIGYAYDQTNQYQRACLWQPGGGMIDLTANLPSQSQHSVSNSNANGINNLGQVVGTAYIYNYQVSSYQQCGIYWEPTYGYSSYAEIGPAFYPYDINNLGQVVGNFGSGDYNAFVWDLAGGTHSLGPPPSGQTASLARAINDQGEAVGYCWGNAPTVAFVWKQGVGMVDLNTMIGKETANWSLYLAFDINNNGQIVGYGTYKGANRGFLLTPEVVPEPSGLLAFGCGLLGTSGILFRRRR